MHILAAIVVCTANILGSFTDPFEFAGDYGPVMNPVRDEVFSLVVPREVLVPAVPSVTQEERIKLLASATLQDRQHGPTLQELMPDDVLAFLQKDLQVDLKEIDPFLEKYKNIKVFRFLKNIPKGGLHFDKSLPNAAAQQGMPFSLEILGSTAPLQGSNATELKENLAKQCFTAKTLSLALAPQRLHSIFGKLSSEEVKDLLGAHALVSDLDAFCSPTGQIFLYFLYQSLNLHLISQKEGLIEGVNQVKKLFASTLGNPEKRAEEFTDNIVAQSVDALFLQESDSYVRNALMKNNLFLPIDGQNSEDGTVVMLRSTSWDSNYQVLEASFYEDFSKGRINPILAKTKEGECFVLASGHGNSTNAADGREQIAAIKTLLDQAKKKYPKENIQLVIGIDANTKTESDVDALMEHVTHLGLAATNVGPTTVKRRMVTTQHTKAGKLSIDEEDYLIILSPSSGGKYALTDVMVGFEKTKPSISRMIPDLKNPSDHYPVQGTLSLLK